VRVAPVAILRFVSAKLVTPAVPKSSVELAVTLRSMKL